MLYLYESYPYYVYFGCALLLISGIVTMNLRNAQRQRDQMLAAALTYPATVSLAWITPSDHNGSSQLKISLSGCMAQAIALPYEVDHIAEKLRSAGIRVMDYRT